MRRLPLLLALPLSACRPDYEVATLDTPVISEEEAPVVFGAAKLQGRVWTPEGGPVANAVVNVGPHKTTTNPKGFFSLHQLPAGQAIVHVEAEGYSSNTIVTTLADETWSYAAFRLVPAEVYTWDPLSGDSLETEDGVRIDWPEQGLVDSFGQPVLTPVQVTVSLLDDVERISAAPGNMMADRDGVEARLKSLGMVEVRITDSAGLPVQIAAPATVSFPLADLSEASDPDGYRLFGFDEARGLWEEAGEGRFEDGRFVAEVEHFSWWNCDNFTNTDQCVTGRLGYDGQPLAGATLQVDELESENSGRFTTDLDGGFVIDLQTGSEVKLHLAYGDRTWESERITLPETVVAEEDRPEGCYDLGSITVRSSDDDGDGFPSEQRDGADCDDDDATINPDATDAPYTGVDEDCGGEDDYDQDQDGYVPDAYQGQTTRYAADSGALPDGDCQDEEYWINPGRVEYCDGQDDNCSGDETDATDASTWYRDQDGDGYGTDITEVRACAQPESDWVENGGDCQDDGADAQSYYPGAPESCGQTADYNCDGSGSFEDRDGDGYPSCDECDDGDAAVHPGAYEACDGVDNNCDGAIDLDSPDIIDYSIDYDADGFGDASSYEQGCSVPDGYLPVDPDALDCDDRDGSRYPGAPELCEDGVVQDCDGSAEEAAELCLWSGELSLEEADLSYSRGSYGDYAGYTVSGAGDVNGDGDPDLLVGAYKAAGGTAYLILGPPRADATLPTADATMSGTTSTYAARRLHRTGDHDGDGYDEVFVGAEYASTTGANSGGAYLNYGPMTGSNKLSDADLILKAESANDRAGRDASGAGDVNGDGFADLIVGAYTSSAACSECGAAYVLQGPLSGTVALADADARLLGEKMRAGDTTATAGDVNGDGIDDVLVGEVLGWTSGSLGGSTAHLVLGPVSGDLDLADADANITSALTDALYIGDVQGAGDVDGDGYDDVIVGTPSTTLSSTYPGEAWLLSGPLSGATTLSVATASMTGAIADDYFGNAVAGVGDLDGDGLADLLIGGSYADTTAEDTGAAWMFLSPVGGAMEAADAEACFTGEESGQHAGVSVAGPGDLDGNGLDDLFIGADGAGTTRSSDAPAAYLLFSLSY